ncbi:MAG: hypothetical protein DWQ37_20625 [Planctomycetota bacterium]|nr:MAG: hypothetical protein DWQ37_20625 [Planctomycetota bacterium]
MATFAAGSTMVALNAMHERDELQDDVAAAAEAIDRIVLAATGEEKPNLDSRSAREKLLQPAAAYYQKIIQKHRGDETKRPQVASAQYLLAGVEASVGSANCDDTLAQGVDTIRQMREADLGPESYPSLKATALAMAGPMEWVTVKNVSIGDHARGLLFTIEVVDSEYTALAQKFPAEPSFRDDHAAMLRYSAILQAQAPGRQDFALTAWDKVAKLMQSLLQDQPGNVEYQQRLVEALVGSAKLLTRKGKDAEAIPKYEQAIEVQAKLVEADPENKDLASSLEAYKKDLAKIQPAEAAKPPGEGEDPAT